MGIVEPQTAFSACFGAPFMPLHPTTYAEMLGKKMEAGEVNVWLVNTGWVGGAYGIGHRIELKYTRAMISAALNGDLDDKNYQEHPIFRVAFPDACPGVPSKVLNPSVLWSHEEAYYDKAEELAAAFDKNFQKFSSVASEEILAGGPTATLQEDAVIQK